MVGMKEEGDRKVPNCVPNGKRGSRHASNNALIEPLKMHLLDLYANQRIDVLSLTQSVQTLLEFVNGTLKQQKPKLAKAWADYIHENNEAALIDLEEVTEEVYYEVTDNVMTEQNHGETLVSGRKASAKNSVWNSLKSAVRTASNSTGERNGGTYSIQAKDFGDTIELVGMATDSEGTPISAGTVSFSLIQDSPQGRFAKIEVDDAMLEGKSTQFKITREKAGRFASEWVKQATETVQNLL